MEYLMALLKGISGEHWAIYLALLVLALGLGFIRHLFTVIDRKDQIINEAHAQATALNERFANSADKHSENALNMSKALTELMLVFNKVK